MDQRSALRIVSDGGRREINRGRATLALLARPRPVVVTLGRVTTGKEISRSAIMPPGR